MTRLLFVYRFCTLGGVESILKLRLAELPALGIEPYALFLRDAGGSQSFADFSDRVFVGADRATFQPFLDDLKIDVLSSVDTFEVFDWLDRRSPSSPGVLLELHSTYDRTLRDLGHQQGLSPDAIIVPSNYQRNHIQSFLPGGFDRQTPIFVVHNAIDPKAFSPARHWGPSQGLPQIVAWVGRLDPLKNWTGFLEIAEQLSDRPNTEIWMVGGAYSERDARQSLRRRTGRAGLASRFRWWPAVRHPDMPRLYNHVAESGGIVVLTTLNESFGLAALEAQAAGCPVVAPAVGGLPEIIEDGTTGFLYPSGGYSQAVERARQLLGDSHLRGRMGERAAEHAHRSFSPHATMDSLVEAVNHALGERSSDG